MEIQTGWKKEDIKLLFEKVKKSKESAESLSSVFEEMSMVTNHKPNSIRNFYYNFLSLLHSSKSLQQEYGIDVGNFKKVQFQTFSNEEIDLLIEHILVEYQKGRSVRKILIQLSDGDKQKMLRLQNKYRSMILNHKDRVERIMQSLKDRGVDFYNPYQKRKSKQTQFDVYETLCSVNDEIKNSTNLNYGLLLSLSRQITDSVILRIQGGSLNQEDLIRQSDM